MKRKFSWFSVGFLVITSIILTSCGTTEETTSVTTTTTTAPTSAAPTTTGVSVETPQYGGQFSLVLNSDPQGFDEAHTYYTFCTTLRFTNEELQMGDWAKGPA